MSKLKQYRAEKKISQAAFARMVGALQSTISKIELKVQIPSLDLAVRIDRATSGEVAPSDWVSTISGEDAEAAE